MASEFTGYIDLAQIVLYAFWFFFAGLIYWLRMEDRREGYPLESDNPRRVGAENNILFPSPKTFALPHGGEYTAPNFVRDDREIKAERTANAKGAPYEPVGDPMLSGVGPASYAQRHDEPELTREGHDAIVPMRIATDYSVSAGEDPREWDVVGIDETVVGTVTDIWVDRADMMVRYLEVELADGLVAEEDDEAADGGASEDGEEATSSEAKESEGASKQSPKTRLVPVNFTVIDGDKELVHVESLKSEHFANVPTTKSGDRITVLEEDRICAYFAGGRLYAEPKRLGPLV